MFFFAGCIGNNVSNAPDLVCLRMKPMVLLKCLLGYAALVPVRSQTTGSGMMEGRRPRTPQLGRQGIETMRWYLK